MSNSPTDLVPVDQRLFQLDADCFDAFVDTLKAPPEPGPKLQSLLRQAPVWTWLYNLKSHCVIGLILICSLIDRNFALHYYFYLQ